jgi:hypothetical protein
MHITLFLKELTDTYIRENFYRLLQYFAQQPLLNADFAFFEVEIPAAQKFNLAHGLNFIPIDVILLSATGDNRFYFRYQEFTKTNLYIQALGPVRIRFLAGNYSNSGIKDKSVDYPFVAPTP